MLLIQRLHPADLLLRSCEVFADLRYFCYCCYPLDTLISFLSILFLFSLSSLSHDFKRFVSKDSNITGFTISADWYKASRTYEISIAFTYAASIVRTSPFCGCWSCYHIDGEAKLQMDCYIIASTLEGGEGVIYL